MERRGFLKATAAAVFGGRKIAENVAAQVGGMSLESAPTLAKMSAVGWGPMAAGTDKSAWAQKEIARYTKRLLRGFSDDELQHLRDEARRMARESLDPDLFVNRSLSLAAKIHLQGEREFVRLQQYRRDDWKRQIRQLKKAAFGGNDE